jgi:Pretoxin HINT domain
MQMQQCFVAGTYVAMADGSARSIEQVDVGDWVLGYDLGTQRVVAAPVVMTFVHPLGAHSSPIVRINESLRATANHPFYSNGRWVAAEALSPGDSLVMLDRVDGEGLRVSSGKVSSLIVESKRETTYNIEVAGVHDYFAGGVLVHNKPQCSLP